MGAGAPATVAAHQPVGIWIRVSTEDQARGESPEHHEKRARHYAEAKEWAVREVYDLCGVSGKTVMEHPETKRMIADVRRGHITGLIFSKLARLARNTRELLELADFFREHDAALISLQESIDTTSPAGRLFYTILAAMAAWEREEIAERVAVSVPIRAKLGKNLGGQAVFGYQWKDGKLIPDPTEAPIRRRICELFIEHRRKKTVARLLNEEGYRTRSGGPFSDTTVGRLLRDPTAKGQRRANYTRSTGPKRSWELKPESEWVMLEVESIVTEELWDRCNAILDAQRKNRKPVRKSKHLFAGLTHCNCGYKMYVPSNSPKYICYRCRNKIPVVDLEAIFHEQLKGFFFSPEQIMAYLKQADEAMQEKEELVRSLEGEQKRVEREMDKVYRAYVDDELSTEGFGSRYKPLEERLKQISDQIPELQAELDLMRVYYLSSDQMVTDAQELWSRWDEVPRDVKRDLIEGITESIVIGKDDVAIKLHYLPPLSGNEATPNFDEPDLQPSNPIQRNDGKKATRPQGFIAATSWNTAG